MSKLADAIRRSQRIESAPMGFGAARRAAKPTMLVGIMSSDESQVSKAAETGADILLLDRKNKEMERDDIKASADLPFGVMGSLGAGGAEELRKAGLDFLAFDPEKTAAAALLDEDLGYALVLKDNPDELFLRSLEPFSLDALIIEAPKTPLTVSHQIELSRISMLTRKPLICPVEPSISKEELQALRAAGVVIVLAARADDVTALKEMVASLPDRRQRKDERTVVSLPRGQMQQGEEEEGDDEYE